MDNATAFLELSALLTGLQTRLLKERYRALNERIAEEYERRLHGAFPQKFPALLDAYKSLAAAVPPPPPPIDDALLAALRATPAFTANEFVARQVVNVWYFSQFDDESGETIDAGFYEHGAVWPIVRAHALGFSSRAHGYWTRKPKLATN